MSSWSVAVSFGPVSGLYIFISSENIFTILVMTPGRTLINMMNRAGPKTASWGIPLFTIAHLGNFTPKITLCFYPMRKSINHFWSVPVMPYAYSLLNRRWRGTESNAFLKSGWHQGSVHLPDLQSSLLYSWSIVSYRIDLARSQVVHHRRDCFS